MSHTTWSNLPSFTAPLVSTGHMLIPANNIPAARASLYISLPLHSNCIRSEPELNLVGF